MIDWSKAPSWANYAAMDGDKEWYWYENKPETGDDDDDNWYGTGGGKLEEFDHPPVDNWKQSLVAKSPRPIPWDDMPDWVVCVAMNANGAWYGCSTEMERGFNDSWEGATGCKYHLFSHIKVSDWMESCIEAIRPNFMKATGNPQPLNDESMERRFTATDVNVELNGEPLKIESSIDVSYGSVGEVSKIDIKINAPGVAETAEESLDKALLELVSAGTVGVTFTEKQKEMIKFISDQEEPQVNEVWWVQHGSKATLVKKRIVAVTPNTVILRALESIACTIREATHKRDDVEFVEKVDV